MDWILSIWEELMLCEGVERVICKISQKIIGSSIVYIPRAQVKIVRHSKYKKQTQGQCLLDLV